MKKFKLILSVIAVTLVFYTCSKDQKVVKELKGDWTVSSITVNGAPDTTDYSQDVYSFSKCKFLVRIAIVRFPIPSSRILFMRGILSPIVVFHLINFL